MMKWIGNVTGPVREDYQEPNRVSSYRGYLYKLRRSQNLLAPQWGKRWFSIESHFLKWYRQESDLFSSGMIDLKYIRSITKLESNNSVNGGMGVISQPYSFMIISDERNITLRASTLHEMNSWIRALHMHADIARGGKGTTVVSDFNQIPLSANHSFKSGGSSSMSGPLSIKRNRGLRASMTLEQELDLTLKKLDELQQEVVSSPPASYSVERSNYQSPLEDEMNYNGIPPPSSPTHYQQMTNKLLKNALSSNHLTSSPFDESMESITEVVVRTPKSKSTRPRAFSNRQTTGSSNNPSTTMHIDEIDRVDSIEDISLSAKPNNRVKTLRMQSQMNSSQNNNPLFHRYHPPESVDNNDYISRSNSNASYDEYDNHYHTRVGGPANRKNASGPSGRGRFSSDLTPISPRSEEEDDEFDFTIRQRSQPTSLSSQANHSSISGNSSTYQSQQLQHSQKTKATGRMLPPSNNNSSNNNRQANGNTRKIHRHFSESNDSADFIIENIPSIDRYEEEEDMRHFGRHSASRPSKREEADAIPMRKRDYPAMGNQQKEWKQATETESVRKSKEVFGIKSAW